MKCTRILTFISIVGYVAAQPSKTSSGPKPASPSPFRCQRLAHLSGADSQTYRVECWSGNIPVGSTAEKVFKWSSGMTADTRIISQSAKLELIGHSIESAQGVDYVSVSGHFALGKDTLPTDISQTSFTLRFDQASSATLSYPKDWKGKSISGGSASDPDSIAQQAAVLSTTSSSNEELGGTAGPKATGPAELGRTTSGGGTASAFSKAPKRSVPTPDRLHVRLKCKKRSAGGVCSVMVRLLVRFKNNTLSASIGDVEKRSKKMQDDLKFKCSVRSWKDSAGMLGMKGKTIDTDVCHPPKPAHGNRKLQQAGAVAQNLAMSAVYAYTTPITVKATRLARYCAASHGCLPSTSSTDQTYVAADGSTQLRQWDGATGMSNWGGPTSNNQPGPECRSCFKEGIDWTDPPKGFQTPEHSLSNPTSFLDAATVFTDTEISGVTGQKAVVVNFRATTSDVQLSQWISNLGFCMLDDTNTVAPTTDAASGTVCNGWNTPVVDLINLGLQADVLRRLNALAPADRTVYVFGHSRGATLASVFAAKLLALQAAGGLPAYSGVITDQIKLYTFGSPRVGDTYFAAYLENNMRERYRIVTRYDAVPTEPSMDDGYSHFRPSIWYRDSTSSLKASPTLGCVLYDEDQLSEAQKADFISCNLVLTCSYGAGADIPGQPTESFTLTTAECTDLSDTEKQGLSVAGSFIDHGSYLGIDVNNAGCRDDVAFIDSITVM